MYYLFSKARRQELKEHIIMSRLAPVGLLAPHLFHVFFHCNARKSLSHAPGVLSPCKNNEDNQ